MTNNYKILGLKVGVSIGVLMSLLFMFSFSGSFADVVSEKFEVLYFIVITPFLAIYSLLMLLMSNSSCSLKSSTDCSLEITISALLILVIFSVAGYIIGYLFEKKRKNE